MYCIKCGVALADTEKKCPLCGTTVYHPEIPQKEAAPLYPAGHIQEFQIHPWGTMFIVTMLFLLPVSICLVCDWQFNGVINWSGYVVGALTTLYVIVVLPGWFRHPNPVIFVPSGFAAVCLYLLYINHAVDGDWFLPFAFPVTGYLCLVVTAVVTLMRYIRKGALFIYGGASFAFGGFMLLLEFLLHITFGLPGIGTWSPYPLIAFALLGATLIILAICPKLREPLERKFFL